MDLGQGWFRFTLSVEHPWFGEMFFQTPLMISMAAIGIALRLASLRPGHRLDYPPAR